MSSDEYDKVELPALEQLQSLGWNYIHGSELSPDNSSLGTDDQKVVAVFERWWDKYQVSLHQIDEEVKQSEEVMWGYLKELGYE